MRIKSLWRGQAHAAPVSIGRTAWPRPQLTTLLRGQSMTEYLVALAVVGALITAAGAGDPSVLQLFLDSVRLGWARLLSALALPV